MIRGRICQAQNLPLKQKLFFCLALLVVISLVVIVKQYEIVAHAIGEQRVGFSISLERRNDARTGPEHPKRFSNQRNRGKNDVLLGSVRSYNQVKDSNSRKQTLSLSLLPPSLSSLSPLPKNPSVLPSPSLVQSVSFLGSSLSSTSSSASPATSSQRPTSSSSLHFVSDACSYEGLKKEERLYKSNMSCVPHSHTERDCNEAFKYFGNYSLESEGPKCSKKTVTKSVCTFITQHRLGPTDRVYVKCKKNICDRNSPVHLGCPDPKNGTILRNTRQWLKFHSIRNLEHELSGIVASSSQHGFTFCLIRCKRRENDVTQGLFFPPIIKRQSKQSMEFSKVNVNILLEDSISRRQFYRYLPKTVKALREIVRDPKSEATVLDFELVQSYASFTLPNVQLLMAGKKYQSRRNGIEVLAQKYKSLGYQTLFHEDLCWYNHWGAILSPSYKKRLHHVTVEAFRQAYAEYINSTELHIDHQGMSGFACEVLRSLGHTSPFNGKEVPKVCWNGRFLSHYILTYVQSFLSVIERNPSVAAPALVYTHLNTAHENTGVRIRSDDGPLSQFVTEMARSQNTLTIVLSDHGAKSNDYATKSFAGSLEVYSPMLFMIIPRGVAHKLGKKRMDALLANQRRLVSVLDLHRMLMSLGDLRDVAADKNHQVGGLLAPIPLNRTCADVEGLGPGPMCRCSGWQEFLSGSSSEVVWLAEYALGQLNNMIQKQYTESTKGQQRTRGYGACARFLGKHVERARRELVGKNYVTTLVLVVVPEYGVKSTERFEVQLKYAPVRKHKVTFVKFTRLSFYSKYESCVDSGVDMKLCACAVEASQKPLDIRSLIRNRRSNHETIIQPLDSQSCLFLVARKKNSKRVLAFEIANVCEHSSFTLGIRGIYKLVRISRSLPFALQVKPTSVHFLFSVLTDWKFGRFRPVITVQRFADTRGKR